MGQLSWKSCVQIPVYDLFIFLRSIFFLILVNLRSRVRLVIFCRFVSRCVNDFFIYFPLYAFMNYIFLVSSIRTPMLIQGRSERTETNPMHFNWEVTLMHGNQSNTF